MTPIETAVVGNFIALTDLLAEAARIAADARDALDRGAVREALGAVMPVEQILKDSLALYAATVILHTNT